MVYHIYTRIFGYMIDDDMVKNQFQTFGYMINDIMVKKSIPNPNTGFWNQ